MEPTVETSLVRPAVFGSEGSCRRRILQYNSLIKRKTLMTKNSNIHIHFDKLIRVFVDLLWFCLIFIYIVLKVI